jgi:hypothetical protein
MTRAGRHLISTGGNAVHSRLPHTSRRRRANQGWRMRARLGGSPLCSLIRCCTPALLSSRNRMEGCLLFFLCTAVDANKLCTDDSLHPDYEQALTQSTP